MRLRRAALAVVGACSTFLLTAAGSAPTDGVDSACPELLSTPSPVAAPAGEPYAVHRDATDGPFTALWMVGAESATHNVLVSCTFHDTDGDRRRDGSERIFSVEERFSVHAARAYGRWPSSVVLDGVAAGEQVCNRRTLRSWRTADGTETRTSGLTCFRVELVHHGAGPGPTSWPHRAMTTVSG